MNKIAIVSAYRTAVASFGGKLSKENPVKIGSEIVKTALRKINLSPKLVDEVIFGNVLSGGLGQNISRQISISSGIPEEKSAFTVNKVCGSGLKSVTLGAQSIMTGENDIVVCGGIEFMSQAPYLNKKARFGNKLGSFELTDSIICDGLTDAFNNYHMGITAENIAKKYNITREEADTFALNSQKKACEAIKKGKFKEEIVPIEIKVAKKIETFDTDEYPRENTNLQSLAKLKPAFSKEGIVTAGNSSGINDGVACVILMSDKKAKELNIKPLAYIEGFSSAGLTPSLMGLGPVYSTKKLLKKQNIDIKDIDLFELNEAFATQSLAVIKELKIDEKKVNVNGGAIAIGHPIGASGSRILVTLIHELKKQNKKLALASLCIGGGQGMSLLISNNIE